LDLHVPRVRCRLPLGDDLRDHYKERRIGVEHRVHQLPEPRWNVGLFLVDVIGADHEQDNLRLVLRNLAWKKPGYYRSRTDRIDGG